MNICDHVERAVKQDKQAQNELIRIVKDKVFNLCVYYLGDFHLAQDASQEILIKIIGKLSDLKHPEKFENWSYTLASNHLRNQIRDSKKYRGISFEAMERDSRSHLEMSLPEQNESDNIRELAYELKVSCTTAMLMCLKSEDRIIFVLSEIFNFKSPQIAEILGINAELVRKRQSRSKIKLKNFIDNNCGLLNKNNACQCKERVAYAKYMGRISDDYKEYTNTRHLLNEEVIDKKIGEMEALEDMQAIFKNNPEYQLPPDVFDRIRDLMEN